MRKKIPMEDGGRTDKDDRFSVEQSTIAKNRIYNFTFNKCQNYYPRASL
jgi:hypothetical protein